MTKIFRVQSEFKAQPLVVAKWSSKHAVDFVKPLKDSLREEIDKVEIEKILGIYDRDSKLNEIFDAISAEVDRSLTIAIKNL